MNHYRNPQAVGGSYWAWLAGGLVLIGVFLAGALALQTPAGHPAAGWLNRTLALDSVQIMWFITRSAGLTSYLLVWFSVAWGLAVPSKILDRLLHRSFTYDFHQFISLLAIGFIALHIGILMFDRYLPYNLAQILVPFLSPYRPVWVGIGVLSLYLILLVTVTYYLRARIGMKAFRMIHGFSLLAYLGVLVHAVMSGTDTSLMAVSIMYAVTFLVTVFLTAYWAYVMLFVNKRRAPAATRAYSKK
jgi:predicted ferric reductase